MKTYNYSSNFDDLFSIMFQGSSSTQNKPHLYTEDGVKKMDLILPGYSKEDLLIKATSTNLNIKTKEDFKETKSRPKFSRHFEFENAIETESIKAKMEHGILTIAFETNVKDVDITID